MKTYRVRFSTKTHSGTMETTITARTAQEAKSMIQGQYGSNLGSIWSVTEVR